jgi:NAD(P)-dependent dehydrogenase (short-subunit alcohol dehydrogenase family)
MNAPFQNSKLAREKIMSLFDLSGKVALVTGSTKGIGEAIVHRLAEHGAKVVVSSRKVDACAQVADAINRAHGKGAKVAVPIPANINYKEQLQNLVTETRAAFGRIDVLVCNAALNPYFGPQMGIPDEAFDKIMGANVRSNHWLCQLVLPEMIERKDGSIIIVSSIGGLRGSAVLGAYCISKAADFQLARNIAVEYGPHNVRANCIAPGLIKTDFAKALWDNPEILKRSTANAPLRRIGEPDEIAGAAVFLASKAGAFMTGQAIVVDGGVTIA